MSTFEFGRTVPQTRGADATTIAREIARACIEDDRNYNGLICISENAVHNGSGDLRHINWEARVSGIAYATAQRIHDVINAFDIQVGITEDMPDDFESYGMFTTEGANRVKQLLAELEDGLQSGKIPAQHLGAHLETAQAHLVNEGHGEVHDTAVREVIWEHLDKKLAELGLAVLER